MNEKTVYNLTADDIMNLADVIEHSGKEVIQEYFNRTGEGEIKCYNPILNEWIDEYHYPWLWSKYKYYEIV